ncbi:MAG: DsbA family protein [Halobaculum sp.]
MSESSDDSRSRRAVLLGGGVVAAGAVGAGALTLLGGDDTARTAVAEAPVPPAPGEYRYATTAADGDDRPTVTYIGSYKCPACARFSSDFFEEVLGEYVSTGEVALEFRHLAYVEGEPFLGPDAPNAGHAGLAVWNADPDSYWAFHERVMANQPPESETWATADRLTEFAADAGVADPSVVREAVEQKQYESAIRATSEAAKSAGIEGTPALVIDGEAVTALQKSEVRSRLDDLG